MLGRRLSLCQPAPINNKEFTTDYVTAENIEYVRENTGTDAETQYHFPSLIRNPQFKEVSPLTVLYPYYNDDVFDAAPCLASGPAGHIKRNNTIYGDSIRAIGYTIRNKDVYLINGSVVPYAGELGNYAYSGVYSINNPLQRDSVYRQIKTMIKEAKTNYPEYIVIEKSDETFGYFITEGVKLNYNATNILFIFVDYGDGTWEYRRRVVESRWYGGIVRQTSYDHTYGDSSSGYDNTQPYSISSPARANVYLQSLGNSVDSSLLSSYSFNNLATGITYYSWCIKWISVEAEPQERWGAIGNTNLILAEIDNIDLNYIFDWEIEAASLEANTEIDALGDTVKTAGDKVPDSVELEVVIQNDKSLPPNFCVLKPKEDIRFRFFNSEWTLSVDYKYKKFTNDNPGSSDDIVSGAGTNEFSVWRDSPYSVGFGDGVVEVENITTGPVKVLGYFYDENYRLIACNATKLLVNIVNERCRCIDIKYQYYAETMKMSLQPDSGFCIDIASVVPTGETVRIIETPNCGDHEYSEFKWEGPMWFPYNSCRGYDLYDEWTICNHCQAGYIGPINAGVARDSEGELILIANTALKRNDFRYCGPYQQQAYGGVRSATPSPCNCGCKFYYADARNSSVKFSGRCRLRAPVNEIEYAAQNWTLPPFGNDGREYIEKYLSHDFLQHFSSTGLILSSWMPLVMDHSMFYFPDFDCFSSANNEDEYYYISASSSLEPFAYTNQLNLFTVSNYNEEIKEDRYRWEDIFEIEQEGNCSYPLPAYLVGTGNAAKAIFYYFKDNNYCWAWQEAWSDIERGLTQDNEEGGNKFVFFELEYPKYQWSVYKEEHRLVATEGNTYIKYIPPEIDEDSRELSRYPQLALGEGPPRAFKIFYDEYDSTPISWADEGGYGTVSGSSNEDNIYEKTIGGDWIQPDNMIFEAGATSEKGENNSITTEYDDLTGETSESYYNTGIIVNMTRDRLDYLPKNEEENAYIPEDASIGSFGDIATIHTPTYSGSDILGLLVWDKESVTISTAPEAIDPEIGISMSRIYIAGSIGYVNKPKPPNSYYSIVKPAVTIAAEFFDGTSGLPRGYGSLISKIIEPSEVIQPPTNKLYNYIIDMNFALGPEELLRKKRIKNFTITITGKSGSYIAIDELNITTANIITVADTENQLENIYIWERKYLISEMASIAYNLDGPDDYLKYDLKRSNAGQYFPFTGPDHEHEEIQSSSAHSKMRSIACGIRYTEDETIDITYNTLHEVEKTTQKYYYEYAFKKDDIGDTLIFNSANNPKLEEYLFFLDTSYSSTTV